ncbi:MAG: SDR family NAD(P)-dependent oxidoreductase, partial [Rhodospirillales bacterium]|nr:SDR family NAD(P)-dependent oxidoreductase [Rhodospirillales bacterium]
RPWGWERLWLAESLPERLLCHARLREVVRDADEGPPEVLSGDLRFYSPDGMELGGLNGYTVKRATRTALLAATESFQDLLYEIVWQDRPLAPGMPPADFLTSPTRITTRSLPFTDYLANEGVEADGRTGLLDDLERLSQAYALSTLERLGWQRRAGESVEPETLRQQLQVLPEHQRLFRRLFEMLSRAGLLEESGDGFVVKVGQDDPLPESMPRDVDEFADLMSAQYLHGGTEIGLFRRCAAALADALVGNADPLTLLFSSGEPTAADLYLKAPVARAANRMLGDAVAALLEDLPEGRRLRVLEIGAGTGSATVSVLPELPAGRFDYVYTDISAGFFSEAEERFGDSGGAIEYRVLDIEKDPLAQGFPAHGYDLLIASNVLHATRYLSETLAHCRDLLAPSGQLVALENLRGQGWLDLTFGQLDGWWRFADDCRPHHALASPAIWRQALGDAGFGEVEVLGIDKSESSREPDRGVILARGPSQVKEAPGVWVLAADRGGVADELAAELAAHNQTVVLAGDGTEPGNSSPEGESAIVRTPLAPDSREAWRALFERLPGDAPLSGIVHLAALDGRGDNATTDELGEDARRTGGSALALVQGAADADVTPGKGVWFVTRGGQVLEREHQGELSGATLWGLGKVAAREAPHLHPRMLDLDPMNPVPLPDLVNELVYPDAETHVAFRLGIRQAARLVRAGTATERLTLPDEGRWFLEPDPGGALERLQVLPAAERPLEPKEVRVAVEAAGLNFWDLFRALSVIDEGLLGGEMCGHVIEVGSEVTSVSAGDRVVALAFGTFSSEAVMHEEMVAPAPPHVPTTALATMPTVFVSAALSFGLAELKAGERVLIHAGAGGVGLAAIQLAHAAGAEVFATASKPKQAYLRSLGVKHVFDSRRTAFGQEILAATGGEGVHVVLNSLTGEGFIEASLSCLAPGGRFVELARVDIYSDSDMAAARPDVTYHILELDVLKEHDPGRPGAALRNVMQRLAAGELTPLVHTRWSMGEAGPAMKFMRAARHVGKIVLTNSPLETGRLRQDRSYLVTGGLGGIGCALAGWLADRGAGAIVLNGRRDPDPEAVEAIAALRERGVRVQVELADVTDPQAVDAMLERMDAKLPPLAGVIHSVGVLS